ncbi:MAG: DUF2267 domain-containing protein [Myxococcaceae bacterium]
MPVPPEFERASTKFYEFLIAARDNADLTTTHQAFTMTEGVLYAFRRRLTVKQALDFANELPLLLRALFVGEWEPGEPARPFGTVEEITREAQALRADHNYAPASSISAVARALRGHVYPDRFAAMLERLPPEAKALWRETLERPPQR